MKKIKLLLQAFAICMACLFPFSNTFAQWGGPTLALVAETDFSVAGGDADYWHSLDMVDGYGNSSILPTILLGNGFTLTDSTGSSVTESSFLDNRSYAVTPNPIRLDSLRMYDNGVEAGDPGDWGIVFSGGKMGLTGTTLAVSMIVPGLKNGGNYRVVVEYVNPLSKTYLNTSGANPDPHLSSGYQSRIKIGTNNSQLDGAEVTALAGTSGASLTANVSNPVTYTNSQGPISGNKLKVDVLITQMAKGEAIMIKSIKVYAELDVQIVGESEVCAGGATTALTLTTNFLGCTYQWYKDGAKMNGATNVSVSHESGNQVDVDHSYYCEITTKAGEKVKSQTFKVKDIKCCLDKNENPADQKLIWMDDFGTFTSAKNYWTWDYTDISNPKKVNHTDGSNWQHDLPTPPEDAAFAVVQEDGACNCPPRVTGADANKFAEGYYTVAAHVTSYGAQDNAGANLGWVGYFGDGTEPHNNGYPYAPDHTYMGSDYGAMLYLNIGSDPGALIYGRTITGLCDRHVTVKCFLNCFSRSQTNPISVFIRVTDLASGTVNESQVYTRYANTTSNTYGIAWIPASVSIDLTGTEMKFEIVSKSGGETQNKDGNDLILDDIMIYACAEPSVNMFFDLPSHLEKTKTCGGEDVSLYVEETKMIQTNIGPDARYIYQYSTTPNDLNSWKTITGPTKDIMIIRNTD